MPAARAPSPAPWRSSPPPPPSRSLHRARALGQRRQQRGDAVAALDPVRLERVREPAREVLELAELNPALVPAPVLPDHREALALVLVADVGGDVVALGHVPGVLRAHLVVGA